MAEFIPGKLRRKERARVLGRAGQAIDGIGDQETAAGAGNGHVHETPLFLEALWID